MTTLQFAVLSAQVAWASYLLLCIERKLRA
jgi:hypothetical protein